MEKRYYLFVFLFLSSITLFSQNTCVTEAMKGYTGTCDFSCTISSDGMKFYTSDGISLKIWDAATNKVVDEVSPFPYHIIDNDANPEVIRIRVVSEAYKAGFNPYNTSLKSFQRMVRPTSIMNDDVVKILKDRDPSTSSVQSPETMHIVYRSKKGNIKKIDLKQKNKVTDLGEGEGEELIHPPNSTVVATYRKVNGFTRLCLVDLITDKWVNTSLYVGQWLSPSKPLTRKHVLVNGNDGFAIINTESGEAVAHEKYQNQRLVEFRYTSDSTRVFIYSMSHGYDSRKCLIGGPIYEFTYPAMKLIGKHDVPWGSGMKEHSMLDPNTGRFYLKATYHSDKHKELEVFDLRTGKKVGDYSFEEKGKFENEDRFAVERELRTRAGNEALQLLTQLPEKVTPCHNCVTEHTTFTKIDDYNPSGHVLIRDDIYGRNRVILWKFPEGTPQHMYFSSTYGGDWDHEKATLVPSPIRESYLSPAGDVVGLNTQSGGVYLYRGKTVIFQKTNGILKGLLKDKALIFKTRSLKDKPDASGYELIDLNTGKAESLSIKIVDTFNEERTRIFFSFTPDPTPKVQYVDIANPTEVKTAEGAEAVAASGYPYMKWNEHSASVINSLTKKADLVPNLKVPPVNMDNSNFKIRDQHIITFNFDRGFSIFNMKTQKSITNIPLYAGWWEFKDVVYLKGINKLLVIHNLPMYTAPNAGENDPGASAYTIDTKTGMITPYLTSVSRKSLIAADKAFKAQLAYSYTPEGRCAKGGQYKKGTAFNEKNQFAGFVVGYDCEEDVYVFAYREVYDKENGVYLMRLAKKTLTELRAMELVPTASSYQICPTCNGHPVSFSKETTSGWSDWEQKSLNIYVYTRKWETKTTNIRHTCQHCKGAAFIR